MPGRLAWRRCLGLVWETGLSAALVVLGILLVTLQTPTLVLYVAWQLVALLSIGSSLAAPRVEYWSRLRWRPGWAALLPLLAGLVGVQSAVWALLVQASIATDLGAAAVAGLAAAGVLLSWLLVHIGFSEIYALLDRNSTSPAFAFPGEEDPTSLKYTYLAVTIGTSFAVSDVTVLTRRARMAVMIHSVISFGYNTLAVAVALQVLQKLIAA